MSNKNPKTETSGKGHILQFDSDGNYIRVKKNDSWNGSFLDNKGQFSDGKNGWVDFSLADPVDDFNSITKGYLKRLVWVEEEEILSLLKESGAFNESNRNNALEYLKNEGIGFGKFDFAYIMADYYLVKCIFNPWESLYLVKEKTENYSFYMAHNPKNFGNYLFGAGSTSLKVPSVVVIIGGHYNSIVNTETNGYDPQWDSEDDQRSIRMGIFHAQINNYTSRTEK